MTLRQIRIGPSANVIQYDDGDFDKAISVEDPIECTAAPLGGNDVLRLDDVGTSVGDIYGPAGAVDSNIAEFDGVTGKKLKDGSISHTDASDAVSKKHARSHAISSTSDHSDVNLAGISNNDLMQWDDPSSKWLPKSIAEVVSGNSISPGPITISDVEDWRYAASIADDGTKALPTIKANYAAIGNIVISSAGDIDESAEFEINSTGTCQIIRGSANVIVNADTDTKVCLGTAATQNPLTIKNRLGGVKNIMITIMYVKA